MPGSRDVHEYFMKLGWKKNPFSLEIDPNLFVGYEEQTKRILRFIDQEEKVAMILGPTGSGKTTMLKWIETTQRKKYRKIIYLPKPPRDTQEFLSIFLTYFPQGFFERIFSKKPTIYTLDRYVNRKLKGRHLLLLVDEAHETNKEVLEWLRAFIDHVERGSMILAGLVELENMIKENLTTLYERITEKVMLKSLSKTETYLMIKKRIEKMGGKNIEPFTDEAIEKVYEITGGFPREVLKLCDRAVKYAVENGIEKITSDIIDIVALPKEEKEDIYELLDSLTIKQRKIVEIIATKAPITTSEMLNYIDISEYKSKQHAIRSINNILKKLLELKLVTRRKEGGRYVYYPTPKVETVFVEK